MAATRLEALTLAAPVYGAGMPELTLALTLTALMAATLQYAILIRHRAERRDAVEWQAEVRDSLVSIGRTQVTPVRRWTEDGRFRIEP